MYEHWIQPDQHVSFEQVPVTKRGVKDETGHKYFGKEEAQLIHEADYPLRVKIKILFSIKLASIGATSWLRFSASNLWSIVKKLRSYCDILRILSEKYLNSDPNALVMQGIRIQDYDDFHFVLPGGGITVQSPRRTQQSAFPTSPEWICDIKSI